jgi:Leucine-rich repeat (LRR) protein
VKLVLFLLASLTLAHGGDFSWINEYGGRFERDPAGAVVAVNLRASWISDSDLIELGHLPKLERLDLSFTRITDRGILYLKSAANLVEVNLAFAERLGDQGQAAIQQWKHLKRLNLRGTKIADNTVSAAAALPELEVLDISYTDALDSGLDALATAPKLKELSIGGLRITEVAFQSVRQISGLERLDLGGGKFIGGGQRVGLTLDDATLQAIASLKELRELKLGYANFPSRGLAILKTLPKLERLNLNNCSRIDDDAIEQLASWKSLRWVDLNGTRASREAVEQLRNKRPDCRVLWE